MIYKGSQKEGKIYKGSNVIKYVYKGSVCIYNKSTLGWLAWYALDGEKIKVYMSASSATNLKQYVSGNKTSYYTNNPNNFNNNVVNGGELYASGSSCTIKGITASFSSLSIKEKVGFANKTRTFTRKPEKDIYI